MGKNKWKIVKAISMKNQKPAPLLFITISFHIFPLVYSYSFILKSVQHYVWGF